jgi:hypothetical protein
MAPTRDTAIGPLQTSQNTQLTLVPCDDSQGSAQRPFRSRSDSLDIFTMSPLGTPPFDSHSGSQVGPSTPQLRLPEPPALDLDLEESKPSHRAADFPIPNHSPSPPSTPNSPALFSFSPPGHTGDQHPFGAKVYPFEPQSHSVVGGTSYGTDMTSVVGSWDDKQLCSENPIAPILEDKGKAAHREPYDDIPIALEFSSSKGKGKAVDERSTSSSPYRTSFGFDFDFQHAQDLNLELKSVHGHEDEGVAEDDASHPPVVRLSPGSQYRHFGEGAAGVYAGPSTRNGDIASLSAEEAEDVEDVEDVSSSPDLGSSQDAQASSASSSRPPSPPLLSGPSMFHPPNEESSELRLPTHRRSLSSISLRSIRSSSSRSIASLRSTFAGAGIRGKVR